MANDATTFTVLRPTEMISNWGFAVGDKVHVGFPSYDSTIIPSHALAGVGVGAASGYTAAISISGSTGVTSFETQVSFYYVASGTSVDWQKSITTWVPTNLITKYGIYSASFEAPDNVSADEYYHCYAFHVPATADVSINRFNWATHRNVYWVDYLSDQRVANKSPAHPLYENCVKVVKPNGYTSQGWQTACYIDGYDNSVMGIVRLGDELGNTIYYTGPTGEAYWFRFDSSSSITYLWLCCRARDMYIAKA